MKLIKDFDDILELNNPNLALVYYLMSCYLYYYKHQNILTDDDFNKLCKYLYQNYDVINHQHKHLVTKEDLKASTGYSIKEYPIIVKVSAELWLENFVDYCRKNNIW